jgi:hydrogenase maturation factor
MAGRVYSAEDQAKLLLNKYIVKVSDSTITYSTEFKVKAVQENLVEGKMPYLIFLDAGFDLDLIGQETPKECLKRWRRLFKKRGEEGLKEDLRGKHSTGRPLDRELTLEEKLRRAEARVKYLESEVDLLEKARLGRKEREL